MRGWGARALPGPFFARRRTNHVGREDPTGEPREGRGDEGSPREAQPSKWNEAKADWNSSGRVAFPEDPEAADKLGNELDTLAKHHNLKAAGELEVLPEEKRKRAVRAFTRSTSPASPALRGEPHRLLEAAEALKCSEPGCYYPLTPKKVAARNHEPIKFPAEGGGEVIAGECSWDPRHADGLQFIPVIVPSKDE